MDSQTNEYYKTLVNNATEVLISKDLDGKILSWNKAAEMLFGYVESEVIGKNIDIIIPKNKKDEEKRINQEISKGRTFENYETERITKKGKVVRVVVTFSPIRDENGQLFAIFCLFKYITDRGKIQDRALEILESAPDAMVVVNKIGQIVFINSQTEKMFGYSKDEIIGRLIEVLMPDRFKEMHFHHRRHYSAEPQARKMGSGLQLFGLKKDNTEFPVDISLSPLETEEGVFVSAAIRDITKNIKINNELKDYARKLEQNNAELLQFAYVASHDLQEPLRDITNFVGLINEKVAILNDKILDKHMSYVVNAAETMKNLIKDLLFYSRIGRNREIMFVNTNKILSELLEELKPIIELNGATVKVGDLPEIEIDGLELKQVFYHLISNAIKFRKIKRNPIVEIWAQENENEYTFGVKDNGIGIEPKYKHKLFLIFQRLHNKNEYSGTGIGLAICKKILEIYNGKIWFESEPNKGATFYFNIPKTQSGL